MRIASQHRVVEGNDKAKWRTSLLEAILNPILDAQEAEQPGAKREIGQMNGWPAETTSAICPVDLVNAISQLHG